MKTKMGKQSLVTGLTALATAVLCQISTSYASDIEIYKAPTQGGATLMFVLDLSGSMATVDYSHMSSCTADDLLVRTQVEGGNIVEFAGYCFRKSADLTTTQKNTLNALVTTKECIKYNKIFTVEERHGSRPNYTYTYTYPENEVYSCPNRVDILKHSLFNLLAGNSVLVRPAHSGAGKSEQILTNSKYEGVPLPTTASIGLATFKNTNPKVETKPLSLESADNVEALLKIIKDMSAVGSTPIAWAYSVGAAGLMDYVPDPAVAACSGYGVYYLTDGAPQSDNFSKATNTTEDYLNYYLNSNNRLTQTTKDRYGRVENQGNCDSSWECVSAAAQLLQTKNNTKNTEVKTAIIGFGSSFNFNGLKYDPQINYVWDVIAGRNPTYPDNNLRKYFSSNTLNAAIAAVNGKGGWYSAQNTNDIVDSVDNFVKTIKIEIPAISTGSPSVLQDSLNKNVLQPYAYFNEFTPKPGETYQAWTGNLKKFKVLEGGLVGRKDKSLYETAGLIDYSVHDLWTQNHIMTAIEAIEAKVKTNEELTATEKIISGLLSHGGVVSRLKLKAGDGTAFSTNTNLRKVLMSVGSELKEVNENFIKTSTSTVPFSTRAHLLGLLGYNITADEISKLTTATNLATFKTTDMNELRQAGAVMHSTPVLLTQSGKIASVDGVANTDDRDDYVLYGTTQGVLHVVKAGNESNPENWDVATFSQKYEGGKEVFAFVPEEMLSSQPTALLHPSNTPEGGYEKLYYGIDGPWVAHTEYVYNENEKKFTTYYKGLDGVEHFGKQWVYGGMRMGGRSYYALDLTQIDSPTIKFRIDPKQGKVFSKIAVTEYVDDNLKKMGQSWSKPTLATVTWQGKRRLVMFVGGGYDEGYEKYNYNQEAAAQNLTKGTGKGIGTAVFMFDANTGEPLWSTYNAINGDVSSLKYSVVSQIKTVDQNGDGTVEHLYFGDLGGQLFRVDLNQTHSSNKDNASNFAKNVSKILSVGQHKNAGYAPRFYEMPAFSVYDEGNGLFAVVSIGSGNRSTPLLGKKIGTTYITKDESYTENLKFDNDAIYNIYDYDVVKEDVKKTSQVLKSDLIKINDQNRYLVATQALKNNKGWYYEFTASKIVNGDPTKVTEKDRKAIVKVQGDLIVVDNDLIVTTFDAEGIEGDLACGSGIYGDSHAHRFCMPFGQCEIDTSASDTLLLGRGILGVTMGPGKSPGDRMLVTPLKTPSDRGFASQNYQSIIRLVPQSWYEKK